jgi:hypothetical protein
MFIFHIGFIIDNRGPYVIHRSLDSIRDLAQDLLDMKSSLTQPLQESTISNCKMLVQLDMFALNSMGKVANLDQDINFNTDGQDATTLLQSTGDTCVEQSPDSEIALVSNMNIKLPLHKQDICRILEDCLSNYQVVHSKGFSHFLWDTTGTDQPSYSSLVSPLPDDLNPNTINNTIDHDICDSTPTSAIDFLMQPIESQLLRIERQDEYVMDYEITKNSTIVWRFSVGGAYDIEFSAYFIPNDLPSLISPRHPKETSGGKDEVVKNNMPSKSESTEWNSIQHEEMSSVSTALETSSNDIKLTDVLQPPLDLFESVSYDDNHPETDESEVSVSSNLTNFVISVQRLNKFIQYSRKFKNHDIFKLYKEIIASDSTECGQQKSSQDSKFSRHDTQQYYELSQYVHTMHPPSRVNSYSKFPNEYLEGSFTAGDESSYYHAMKHSLTVMLFLQVPLQECAD